MVLGKTQMNSFFPQVQENIESKVALSLGIWKSTNQCARGEMRSQSGR